MVIPERKEFVPFLVFAPKGNIVPIFSSYMKWNLFHSYPPKDPKEKK